MPYDVLKTTFLQAKLKQIPGLRWTHEIAHSELNYLDIWIYKDKDKYKTRTYQKSLNLYLYPTFQSAHPPGLHRGMIYGLLLKYKQQNSEPKDFKIMANLLYQRLLLRGFKKKTLLTLFNSILQQLDSKSKDLRSSDQNSRTANSATAPSAPRKVFLKLPFDPNGPTRSQLRQALQLNTISRLTNCRVVICYQRPRNLGDLLMRTRFVAHDRPAPQSPPVEGSGVNPNPSGASVPQSL